MLWIERLKDWHQERKYRRQRAQRGWSVKDTWEVDTWFLTVVPEMLEYLKEHHHGFPTEIQREYLEAHREELGMTYEEFCIYPADENSEGYKLREKIDDICDRRWDEILGRMIFLFREANRETCTVQNPYKEENRRIDREFTEKYGMFGEKLLKPEDISPDGGRKLYTPMCLPEYREAEERYLAEEEKIWQYQDRCKTEALDLFNKWFWSLWD